MDVGFIGLGNIGGPRARHLAEAGHAMLDAILDRRHDIEAAGEPTYTRTNRLSGLRTLPIALTGRAAAV